MMLLEKTTDFSTSMNARLIDSGTESTIVLAHGYGTDQSIWEKVVPCLETKYKVVVFDWPFSVAVSNKDPNKNTFLDYETYSNGYDGFADDLIGLIDELNLKSTILVGHSMSGMIGCIASIKRPDLFNRLLLLGASPRYINDDEYEGGFESEEIENLLTNIETNFLNWTSAFASLAVGSSDPTSVTKITKCLQSMRSEVAHSLAKTVFYSDQRDILDMVCTPCTIIQTTNDIVVPGSVAYYMHHKIKGKSTVEFIEIDGHFPQLTAHQKLVDLINGVLGFCN